MIDIRLAPLAMTFLQGLRDHPSELVGHMARLKALKLALVFEVDMFSVDESDWIRVRN
jgi:hypothetical protein